MADILTIGSSGLSAYRRSLEVTGNNIVNANTEGYARRDVQLQGLIEAGTTPTALRTGSGGGVAIDVIRRATDTFVQAEMRTAASSSAEATALADRLDRLEKNLFSADTDLSAAIQNFFGKIQDFASTPTSIPIRVTVLQAADELAADFRAQADKLTNEASAIFSDVHEQLNLTNALTKSIAELNKKLDSLGSDPSKVNDLLDQRDKLVDQLVEYVGVTIEPRSSGALNIYLGNSTNGPKLIDETGSNDLSATKNGTQVSLTLDPYGRSTPIAKIEGGSVGGVLSFGDHVTSALNQLNRLATGFAASLNKQHAQGLDLKGQFGLPLYTSYNLGVQSPDTNKGTATALLDLTNASSSSLSAKGYEARYDSSTNRWTITNLETQDVVTCGSNGVIDGVKITFSGAPENGDVLYFSPLEDAAAGIRLLIHDATQLAASLPQLAETGAGNVGSAQITLTGTQGSVPAPPISQLDQIFNHSLSPDSAINFKSDGVIGAIPSGTTTISLLSLANISAANFAIDPKQLSQPGTTLTISIDGLSPTINIPTEGDWTPSAYASQDPMASLVERINRAFETSSPPLSEKLFANRVGSSLIINALGSSVIGSTPKPYFTLPSNGGIAPKIVADAVETPVTAADIQVLTTEGRQLAGSLTPNSNILTATNGFSSTATLTPVASYRNLSISTVTSPLTVTHATTGRASSVSIEANSTTDGAWLSATSSQSVTAGSVYSLGVAGLPTIRLAGDAIAGKNSELIAESFERQLNELAPTRLVLGQAVSLANTVQSAQFTITIDDVEAEVTFTRALEADGSPLPGGIFEVIGHSGLKLDMIKSPTDATKQQVIITLPQKIGSTPPVMKISGSDASLIGLGSGATLTQRIIASRSTSVSEVTAISDLQTKFGVNATTVTKLDGRLVIDLALLSPFNNPQPLTSLSNGYASSTSKSTLRDDAVSLGLLGTDLTLSRSNTIFSVSSLATDDTKALIDTSATISRIAQKITVSTKNGTDPIPEDLIISVRGTASGQRKILSDMPPTMTRSNPIFPDVEIKVVGAGKIEIFDRVKNGDGTISQGASLGTRNFSSGQPVTFLGATFQIDGNATIGDTYTIVTDPNRIGDNRNGLAMAQLQHKDMLGTGSGTFQEIYQDEIGKIGASSQAAQTSADSLKTVAQNLKTAFDAATGVNLDSEAADLIKLQQAYSACAQIVSTARDMFNTILKAF